MSIRISGILQRCIPIEWIAYRSSVFWSKMIHSASSEQYFYWRNTHDFGKTDFIAPDKLNNPQVFDLNRLHLRVNEPRIMPMIKNLEHILKENFWCFVWIFINFCSKIYFWATKCWFLFPTKNFTPKNGLSTLQYAKEALVTTITESTLIDIEHLFSAIQWKIYLKLRHFWCICLWLLRVLVFLLSIND